MSMPAVRVSVPASTSNLGPGFDFLGLALDLRNELTLELLPGKGPDIVDIIGEGERTLPRDKTNLLVKAARLVLPRQRPAGRLLFKAVNRIPLARGLGSSAAAAVAGLWAGASLFAKSKVNAADLEQAAIKLEGHPDNVAACVRGGLTASLSTNSKVKTDSINIHRSFRAVVAVPKFTLPTPQARAVLPRLVPLADAVFNTSRTSLLLRALESGCGDNLDELMADRLHQPYRSSLVPGLGAAMAAAVKAGAAGAALSGSGPSVCALIQGNRSVRVGFAMRRAFLKAGIKSDFLLLSVDRRGVVVKQ